MLNSQRSRSALRNLSAPNRCQEPFQRPRRLTHCRDGQAQTCRCRRLRLSRAQPGGRWRHAVRCARRLSAVRGRAGRGRSAHADAAARLLLMPNHWHLVLWPEHDGALSRFMTWLGLAHTQRWHARRGSAGSGHLYQGRYKVVPRAGRRPPARGLPLRRAQSAARPLRAPGRSLALGQPVAARGAGRAARRSGWRRCSPNGRSPAPEDWRRLVNRAQSAAEIEAMRTAVQRGRPFGSQARRDGMARRFDLNSTLQPRGRPRQRTAS